MSIKIKKFQNFTNQDTLYVFDLDDTLVETQDLKTLL
jgi:hypothetical protein